MEKRVKENETRRTVLARSESEKLTFEETLLTLQEPLGRHEKEQVSLRRQMAEIVANNQRFTREYLEIEHQNANLANLYVTSYRLRATVASINSIARFSHRPAHAVERQWLRSRSAAP